MTFSEAFYLLKKEISHLYPASEATAIAHEVMGTVTGMSKIDRLMMKDLQLNNMQQNELDYMLDELLQGKPLQYVNGKTWFMDKEFLVNENVLIPRPETEELVIWILNDRKNNKEEKKILEIGTGSGCIPISLKLEWQEASISACDVSAAAVSLAKKNAAEYGMNIHFFEQNILDRNLWPGLPVFDIIVSNPPYIPDSEKITMDNHVTLFEPALALFVADNDPFIFYRTIARLGKTNLKPEGVIYCEIHRDFPEETKAVFEAEGYTNIELRKDMHDNWRMIKAMH